MDNSSGSISSRLQVFSNAACSQYSVLWLALRHALEKLDLLELAYGIIADTPTGPPEIMRRETWNVHARGSLLDNVPDHLL